MKWKASSLRTSTKKTNIEAIKGWEVARRRTLHEMRRCSRSALRPLSRHRHHACRQAPGRRAGGRILDVKFAAKEVELYNKLLLAGKFHA